MKLEQRCRAPQRGRPSRPEQRFRPPQRSRASSSGHFERPSEAERTRAANVSASAKPSGLEQRFRPPKPSGLVRPFRAPQRGRGSSSGHFERPSDADGARTAMSIAPAAPRRARAAIPSAITLGSVEKSISVHFGFILGSLWFNLLSIRNTFGNELGGLWEFPLNALMYLFWALCQV